MRDPVGSEDRLPPLASRRTLTLSGLVMLLVVTCVVTWNNAERYMDPVGEKYIPVMSPGAADFFIAFAATKALLLGENPYHQRVPALADPWGRIAPIGDKAYRINYPPSHFLLYVPLAMITHETRTAGRLLFGINIVALLTLSFITWWLIVAITGITETERTYSRLLLPLLFFILTTNVGTSLGLERGQSDILLATMCWGAVVLFLVGWRTLATCLIVGATAMKGYSVLLAIGICLLGLRRGWWKEVCAGVLLGGAVFVLPVAGYVREGVEVVLWRSSAPSSRAWISHSFENVVASVSPESARVGRAVIAGFCALLTSACWLRAGGRRVQNVPESGTMWLVLFTTCALATMLGWPTTSYVYNQIMILPGILVVLIVGLEPAVNRQLPNGARLPLHVARFVAALLLFKFRFMVPRVPLAGFGIVVFASMIGGLLMWDWWTTRVRQEGDS